MFSVDAKNVYWFLENVGVMKCSKDDCTSPELLSAGVDAWNGMPVDMVSDGKNLYWINGNWVLECAVDGCGGAPTRVDLPYWSDDDMPNRLAVDDTSLYWTTGNVHTGFAGTEWSHCGGAVMKRTPK